MVRIKWKMQTVVGLLTADLPSGVSGDPVVLNLRNADGFAGAVECLSGAERATCLDRALALVQSARRERIVAASRREAASIVEMVRAKDRGQTLDRVLARARSDAFRSYCLWSAHLAFSPPVGDNAIVLPSGGAEGAALAEDAATYRAEVMVEIERIVASLRGRQGVA